MAKVLVYSSAHCGYCVQAKHLLDEKGVAYDEIRVDLDPVEREKMMTLSGQRTVPQIFIDDKSIGGFTDLAQLARSGELDALLK